MKKVFFWLLGILSVLSILAGVLVTVLPALGIAIPLPGVAQPASKNPEPFSLEGKVRLSGTKEWSDTLEAEVGDEVDIRVEFMNISADYLYDAAMWVNIPTYLEYVPGSTILYNEVHPKGVRIVEDAITTQGLLIGNYAGYNTTRENSEDKTTTEGANSFVRFTVRVVSSPAQHEIAATIESVARANFEGKSPVQLSCTNEITFASDSDGSAAPSESEGPVTPTEGDPLDGEDTPAEGGTDDSSGEGSGAVDLTNDA